MSMHVAAGTIGSDGIELEERLDYRPDWRWRQAGRIFKDGTTSRDPLVKQLAGYLKVRHKETIPDRFRPFVQLDRMYRAMQPSAMRWYIEALLLAGATDDEIAGYVGLPPQFVARYHDVFYDVRRYCTHRVALLSGSLQRLDRYAEYDAGWKGIGLECGVVALLAYWGGYESPAVSEVLDRWLTQSMRRAAIGASGQRLRHIHPGSEGQIIAQYTQRAARDRQAGGPIGREPLAALELRPAPPTLQAVEAIPVPEAMLLKRLQGGDQRQA